jgi:hypothetical protein
VGSKGLIFFDKESSSNKICKYAAPDKVHNSTNISSQPVVYPKSGERVHQLSFSFPTINSLPDTQELESELRRLNGYFSSPHKTFGLDQRCQYLLEESSANDISRKPFYRLSQEPLILGAWERIKQFDFTDESAQKFASLLCGKSIKLRDYPMWARGPIGNFVYFDCANEARKWIGDVKKIQSLGLPPIIESIVIYCRIVVSHPFQDGNGRFARAMLYGPLAKSNILHSPCLGLAASMNLKREDIAIATISLTYSKNWNKYISTIMDILKNSVNLVIKDIS